MESTPPARASMSPWASLFLQRQQPPDALLSQTTIRVRTLGRIKLLYIVRAHELYFDLQIFSVAFSISSSVASIAPNFDSNFGPQILFCRTRARFFPAPELHPNYG